MQWNKNRDITLCTFSKKNVKQKSRMSMNLIFRLTILSMAVMIFIIIRNIVYFIQTDHFLEECTSSIYHEEKYLMHYPCLYLDLWKKYNNGNVYDTRHFLNVFFAISTCLAMGFIFSSLCLLVSIYKNYPLMLIPWIGTNVVIVIFLSFLLVVEVHFRQHQHLSKYFFIAFSFIIYSTFNLIWGLTIYFQMKVQIEKSKNEICDEGRFEYMELDTFHNPNDNLSWF